MTTPQTMQDKGNSQAGVALLEVLVAILLFSFGILGLIGLQARAIGYSTDADDRNRAAMLASELASTMWLSNSLTLPDDTLILWKARVHDPAAGGLPGGDGAVTVLNNAANVEITWKAPNRAEGQSRLVTRVVIP